MSFNLIGTKFHATDAAGNDLAGGKVYTYASDTTTKLATYTTQARDVQNPNPVVLDATGRASIWLGGAAYRIVVKNSAGVTMPDGTVDGIRGASDSATGNSINLTAAEGGADRSAELLEAIAFMKEAGGGTIYLSPGTFPCDELVIDSPGVRLVGAGASFFSDSTGLTQPTRILYNGASGGTMLTLSTANGASNDKITDCAVIGIAFDGADIADRGVFLGTMNNCEINISASRCNDVQVEFDCVAAVAQATSSQHNQVRYVRVEATGSADGIRIDTTQLGGNWSKNDFGYMYAKHADGVGIRIGNSDNNWFSALTAERAGGGTGAGIVLGAGDNTVTHACRANQIGNINGGDGGIYAEGTGEGVEPSEDNVIWRLDKDNVASDPVLGTDAKLAWATSRAVMTSYGFVNVGIGASQTTARTAIEQALNASFPVVISAGNSHHIQLSNSSEGKWNFNVSFTTDDYEIVRAGAAGYMLLHTDYVEDYADDAAAAAGGVPLNGIYRNGSVLMMRVA